MLEGRENDTGLIVLSEVLEEVRISRCIVTCGSRGRHLMVRKRLFGRDGVILYLDYGDHEKGVHLSKHPELCPPQRFI